MTHKEFKNAVYELAKFNASLTKGYRNEWKQSDYEGYAYKNREIKRLVDVAIANNYPVFYDGCSYVIYFMFGEVQISFHTGTSFLNRNDFGLPHIHIAWDGVKRAWEYTEEQYIYLKNQRLIELEKRKSTKKEKENELRLFAEKQIEKLNLRLKRARSEKTKTLINNQLSDLVDKSPYALFEYYRFRSETWELCNELAGMYCDSYIHDYSV